MEPESVELAVREQTGTGAYRFICPACMALVEKRADRKIVELLRSVGVGTVSAAQPPLDGFESEAFGPHGWEADGFEQDPFDDVDEPKPEPAGRPRSDRAPFTVDDLIAFHFLLEDDEWLGNALTSDAPNA